MNAIFHRTSIRRYTSQPVTEEQLELLLRAAMAAPSACNQQPWEFYAVTDPEKIAELSKATPFSTPCAGAALVIVPCQRVNCAVPPCAPFDMSAAVENILLEADSLGLGACWMALSPMKQRQLKVAGILGIPDSLEPFCLISCGHPAEERPQQDRFDPARVHRI